MPLVFLFSVGFLLYKLANKLSFSDEKYQYAGLTKRASAGFIDVIIISFFYFIPLSVVDAIIKSQAVGDSGHLNSESNISEFLVIFGPFVYYSIMESSRYQATFGKRILGLRVVDSEGKRISFLRSAGRSLGKFISITSFFIGFIMIGFTKRKQGLHDMIVDCLVVSDMAPFLKHADGAAAPEAPSTPFRAREPSADFQKEALRRFKAGELSEAAFLEIVKRTP